MAGRSRAAAFVLICSVAAGCSGGSDDSGDSSRPASSAPPSTSAPASTTPAGSTSRSSATPRSSSPSHRSATPKRSTAPASKPRASSTPAARSLPLDLSTDGARQVITVTAPTMSSTTATLQRWKRVDHGWRTVGGSVHAYLGSAGMGKASEGSSKTPAGSYTLTQAFGRNSDPGTKLPYTHTTPADWWISQAGSLYNTRQRCASGCDFTRGDPNEHLYFTTPYYNYAVVIDYNTRNAPGGVRPGKGSAFFLHVSVGEPTAGCVSIPQSAIVSVMQWLNPAKHPRMLIGTR